MSVVSVAAETELVSVEQARDWCRADSSDDSFIEALIPAARDTAEIFTGRALVAKTLVCRLDSFPASAEIELDQPPLRSVTNVKYIDGDGTEKTLSSNIYTVDKYSAPGRIVLNYGEIWPITKEIPNAVKITYQAGYADEAQVEGEPNYQLPALLRDGIRYFIAHLFSHRELVTDKVSAKEIPENLLPFFMPFKVNW